jgi:hypothetical protein
MKKIFILFFILAFSFLRNADCQTTIVLQPGPDEGKDAQLWSILPDTNVGNIGKFSCMGWTHNGVPGVNRGLIDFDLSSIPENAQIIDAKLSLYFVNIEPTYFGHTGQNESYLQLVTEPWEEMGVTWNEQPATTTDSQVYLPQSTAPYQDYTDIDVTVQIGKLYAEPDNYHGLMLRLLNENPYNCLLFASSDYSDTIEFRPKLEITYIESPSNIIVIQPGAEGKDAQLWSIMPDLNIGNTPKFVAMGWTHYGVPGVNRALIDFDLSALPENAEIVDAKLSFYFINLEPTYFGHTGDNEAYLQLVTDPWEEDYVTWNEQPLTTEEDQVYLPPSTDPYQDYTDINVTTVITKLFTEPDSYHGLMLKLINEYPYNCLLFASSDYSDTIEMRPKLEITYIVTTNTVVVQPGPEDGKDAQVWTIMPDNNYGDIPKFDCSGWTHYGVPGVNRGLIDFDLSEIPEGSVILDARLNFYFVCLEPTYFGHTGENDAYLQLITDPWEEMGVTWNEQPMTTEEDQVYLPPSTDPYQDYTNIDVTTVITKLFAAPDIYHGLMLRLLDENPYRCLLFASSDIDTVEMRPKLEITYTTYPMPPEAGFSYEIEDLTAFFQDASMGADKRQWDFGDGNYSELVNPTHTYNSTGEYEVCLVTWNKYGSDTSCQYLSVITTKIPDKTPVSFSIYPNPASDMITISSTLKEQADLTIFDLSGRILMNSLADFSSGENTKINVSELPQGIYFARITSGRITETRKIIIGH